MYKPPFTITSKMLDKAISITESIGKISNYQALKRMPILRRNNMIRSIHSSLAIEHNSLSLEQVRDVIADKLVIGDKKEIQEVKNAYDTYEAIDSFDCFKESDLLLAHRKLTNLIIDDSGKYRNHAEGVFDGENVIFVAPPANMVSELMSNLFNWLSLDTETPLLIKSCIFHYEFVFIHPFTDGNGRCARLWQNVILMKWNNLFKYIPVESVIEKYQAKYYEVIGLCHKNGDSNLFIEFMLDVIDETLKEVLDNVKKEEKNISDQVNKLLEVMEYGIPYSANELLDRLNIKSKETLRASYLNPAIENGLVKMTLEDKPNSKNQKYIK